MNSAIKKSKDVILDPDTTEFLLYQTEDGLTRVDVRVFDETAWLSINQMSELFQIDKSGISRHIKNIYETNELVKESTVANFATVQIEWL